MSKKNFIDSVRVRDPCTQAWDEMVGNDKVRFCTHCAKDVNNLSAMTRKDAIKLVRKSGGSLCIRYVQQPRTAKPMFAEELTQITRRRAPLMAAGVVSATLSLATFTYSQGGAELPQAARNVPAIPIVSECEDIAGAAKSKKGSRAETNLDKAGSGVLTGTVLDIQGAVVPNTKVTLLDAEHHEIKRILADEEGKFRFDGLGAGRYSLQTDEFAGFAAGRIENIEMDDRPETVIDITLNIAAGTELVGDLVIANTFEGAIANAVLQDDIKEAMALISRGENVNYREKDGTTPIAVAVEVGNLEMVQLLLDAGAKINARNSLKQTPLMYMDEDATPELINLLLRYGAKVNRISTDGNTALIRAALEADAEVVQVLIDAGARLDVQNELGMTALMVAAQTNDLETVRRLVLAGANVNLKDKEGQTAWDKSNDKVGELLETHGAIVTPPSPSPEP